MALRLHVLRAWFAGTSFGLLSCGTDGFDTSTSSKPKSDDQTVVTASSDPTPTPGGESEFDLMGCGFDPEKPQALLASEQLSMQSFKKTYTVPVLGGLLTKQTEVTYTGSLVLESSLRSQIFSHGASASTSVEVDAAKTYLSNLKSATEAQIIEPAARAKLGLTYPEWSGLFCTLQPTRQLTDSTGHQVSVSFSKPIPIGVLAVAGLERIKAEINGTKSFGNIEAKVTSSDDKNIAVGTVYNGSVQVSSVPVSSVAGVSGDFAVTIRYDFGGADKNKMIGLPTSVTWILDSVQKKVTASQVKKSGVDPLVFK